MCDQADSYGVQFDVADLVTNSDFSTHRDLAAILTDTETAIPLLRERLARERGETALRIALTLGILGDDAGGDVMREAVQNADWDEGWNYRGMGQFGFNLSPVDSLIVALGRVHHGEDVLLEKLATLQPESEFSHIRAIALAFVENPNRTAVQPLAKLLQQLRPDQVDLAGAVAATSDDRNDNNQRNQELKALFLARALYACGDTDDQLGAAVLQDFVVGFNGHYSRHARALLGQL